MLTQQQRGRFSEAIDRLAGDEQTFLRVAGIVSEDAPILIQTAGSAIEGHDFENAATNLHKLKGMLATFIGSNEQLNFAPVVAAIRARNDLEVTEKWRKVEPQIETLMSEINDLIKAG